MRLKSMRPYAALLAGLIISSSAIAGDIEAAKKYVEEAKAQLETKSYDDAKSKLELAEAELDGLPADQKAAVTASIDAVKKQIADSNLEGNKIKYKRLLTNAIDETEGAIGNLATWKGAEGRLLEIFDNADAKAALPDEIAAAQKKYATFKKLNDRKVAAAYTEQLDKDVKEFEDYWTETKPKIAKPQTPGEKDTAITDTDRKLDDIRKTVTSRFAADSDQGKAYLARIDKIGAEYTQLALADQVKEKVAELQRAWDSYKDEWTGWEKETTGPSFEDYRAKQSEEMSSLLAPKSKALISRANQWLKNRDEDENFKKMQSAPEIKAIVAQVTNDRDTALAKMEKFADSFLGEAEKLTLNENNVSSIKRFENSLKNNIEGSAKLDAYDKRALALISKFENAGKAAEGAAAEYYKTMTEKAAAAWPDMKAKFTVTEGFDPNKPGDFKGKYIKITTDNLMGYRFNTGDFPFATTLSGIPVAGKFDPVVAAAITEVQTKMGRALGDSDDDGKWEVIAIVDGSMGKLSKRVNVEGKIKDDAGNTATVTGEKAEIVDAPIVTIVAAHCGPLAVAKGAGSVKENGQVSEPSGAIAPTGTDGPSSSTMLGSGGAGGSTPTSSSGGGMFMWFVGILVGLLAGTVALLKAGFAPLVAAAGGIQQKIGTSNLAYIGLAVALWGVWGLLRGLIIWGLLVNLSLIASGVYAASDFLESKGILKPDLAAKLRPLGVPIGLATIVVVLLSIVTRGSLKII